MFRALIILSLIVLTPQDPPTIPWQSNYRLQWKDFKGKAVEGTRVAAVTASGLSFGYSAEKTSNRLIDFDYHVTAHFYPENSWYLKKRADDNILEHERLHFDITELFARKFRKRVENTKFTHHNIEQEMKRINRAIKRELDAFQKQYDKETNHSINAEAQNTWNKKIMLELGKLSYYSK